MHRPDVLRMTPLLVLLVVSWCGLAVSPLLQAVAGSSLTEQGRLETATFQGVDLRVTTEHTARIEAILAANQQKPGVPTQSRVAAPKAASKPAKATAAAAAAQPAGAGGVAAAADYPKQWAAYKAKYHKRYTPAQEKARYAAFVARAQRVAAKEARRVARRAAKEKATGKKKPPSPKKFTVDHPIFGDMTDAKFKSLNAGPPKKNALHAKIKVFDPKKPRRPLKKKGAAAAKPATKKPATKKPTTKKARFAQLGATPLVAANIPKVNTVAAPRDAGASGPKPKKVGSGESVANTGVTEASMAADRLGTWQSGVERRPWAEWTTGIKIVPDLRKLFPFGDVNGGTIVRNQGLCKSCWAQASAEHAQAIISIQNLTWNDHERTNVRLSAQQIIDCARTAEDTGCNGGTVAGAFQYILQNGLVKSSDYPHVVDGTQHECAMSKVPASAPRYKVKDMLFLVNPCVEGPCPPNPQYEQRLRDFWWKAPYLNADSTAYTPIPLIAYVDASNWDDYSGGIYPSSECSSAGDKMTHVVQIVGSGHLNSDPKKEFWVIRNSWCVVKLIDTLAWHIELRGLHRTALERVSWGDHGHIYLEAGTNPCGLFNYIMYLEPLQAFSEVERQITIAQSNQIFADRMSVPGPRQFPKVDLVQLAKTADYGRRKASQMGGQFADSAVGTASPGPAPYIEAPFKQMIH